MTKKIDKNVISCAHINFLFGAGVNGKSFPQLSGFKETIELLKNKLHVEYIESFEDSINDLKDEDERNSVYAQFSKEFEKFVDQIDFNDSSLKNLSDMLAMIYEIVDKTENRQRDMKQINIYTLNYDTIVDQILDIRGYLHNSVSASNLGRNKRFFDMVGYDYSTFKYVPSFMISRLHGDIDKPIFPGVDKYKSSLADEYFEINYRMKEQLSKDNSILIVIGYSGRDGHINKIIEDCLKHELIVYWFRYDKKDKVLDYSNDEKLIIFDQPNDFVKIDTTLICTDTLKRSLGRE